MNRFFDIHMDGNQPVCAVALHDGHDLRDEAARAMALTDSERMREEDPFTGEWTGIVDNRIIVKTSRFEVDLNRSRDTAVYIDPEDAWGLTVWKSRPDTAFVARSLEKYDAFYAQMHKIFSEFKNRFGRFVVFDIHSYNHRRHGPDEPPADSRTHPEVNIGTKTMNRKRWARIIDRFMSDLSNFDYLERHLDVRENVKFYGRQFAQWTHETFPESACVLSIEFKKFFMNEWTGRPDDTHIAAIKSALKSTVAGMIGELKTL